MKKYDKNYILNNLGSIVNNLVEDDEDYYTAKEIIEAMIFIKNIDIVEVTEKQCNNLIITKLIDLIDKLINEQEKEKSNEKN